MLSSVRPTTGCKPSLGCAPPTERSRSSSGATLCHSHLKQLSKLTDALEENTFQTPRHPEVESLQVVEQFSQLRERWAADDAAAEAAHKADENMPELKRGMRMVGDALEIDFSVYKDSEDEGSDEDLPAIKRLPREVKYFDTARIHVKAGDGGTGCCAFRREKFVSHGGPCGGTGGNGGSVWAIAEEGMNSLLPFRNSVHWKAKAGVNGGGKDMHGANAQDTYIKVPPGIIIRHIDAEDDEPPLAELIHSGTAHAAPVVSCRSLFLCLLHSSMDIRKPILSSSRRLAYFPVSTYSRKLAFCVSHQAWWVHTHGRGRRRHALRTSCERARSCRRQGTDCPGRQGG